MNYTVNRDLFCCRIVLFYNLYLRRLEYGAAVNCELVPSFTLTVMLQGHTKESSTEQIVDFTAQQVCRTLLAEQKTFEVFVFVLRVASNKPIHEVCHLCGTSKQMVAKQ